MEQSKIRTYLFYAVGEIALVMIGILMALQVNNWNEERSQKIVETHMLENLLTDLRESFVSGNEILRTDSISSSNLQYFLFDEQKRDSLLSMDHSDSLVINFLWSIHIEVPIVPAFEDIKNAGTSNLITNQEIRNKLAELDDLTFMLRFFIDDKTKLQQNYIDGLIAKNLHMSSYVRSLQGTSHSDTPGNNYRILTEDREFFNRLNMKVVIGTSVLNSRRELQKGFSDLIQLLEKELQQRRIS